MAQWRNGVTSGQSAFGHQKPSGETVMDQVDAFTVFGPTCDSLDRLPGTVALPQSIQDGDYILISGMGPIPVSLAQPSMAMARLSV